MEMDFWLIRPVVMRLNRMGEVIQITYALIFVLACFGNFPVE